MKPLLKVEEHTSESLPHEEVLTNVDMKEELLKEFDEKWTSRKYETTMDSDEYEFIMDSIKQFIQEALTKTREETIRELKDNLPVYENEDNGMLGGAGELNNYIRGSWMGFNTCLDEVIERINKLKK